jgi:hypothetical protein
MSATKSLKREEEVTLTNYKWGALRPLAEKLFATTKRAYTAPLDLDINFEDPEDVYGIYKTTGEYLGTVGGGYEALEPLDFLRSISEAFKGEGREEALSRIEYTEYFGGKVIGFKVPIRKFELDNPIQKGDVTEVFADFRTGFNGKIANTLDVFIRRCFCDNGCTSIEKEASHKFKHLPNSNLRAKAYATSLIKTLDAAGNYEDMMRRLNDVELTKEDIYNLFEEISGLDVVEYYTADKLHYKKVEQFENMWAAINEEFGRTGKTAYGLLNGFTNYTNHYTNDAKPYTEEGRRVKEEVIGYSKGAKDLNKKAHEVISEFVGAEW